ncbi:M1 family metallopeptidase [Flagellimonas beolgyonensis]|uniref:M1 family metallopeptidase n=1 Tax=Flagellimonas beolgyonensis TaxID=864064 RepID=UPI000F8EA89F|nr:M1 family metallopeptidase [Allomuricauda beolgyonensis]
MKLTPILIFYLIVQCLSAQVQDKVDFVHANVFVNPITEEKTIEGAVTYEFKVLQSVDSLFLDAHNMSFSKVELDGVSVPFENTGNKIIVHYDFKKNASHQLIVSYTAHPKQTVYFLGWEDSVDGNEQIWTQGQGKYTSHWLPSLEDMTEKVEFDLGITVRRDLAVIANGKLFNGGENWNDKHTWMFDMKKPMSSYLVGFAIGNFEKKTIKSSSGVPIELYYEPKDSLKVEPTYRYTQHIFDFLEKEIGVPYPWQNYKQVPVQDFLYAGMENTTCTIFSNQYVIDSTAFVDKNYVNVNAHELAHHWFGDLVTETSSEHHWLHEGFATYYAYLAEKDIFGDAHFHWHLLETAKALQNLSEEGQGEALQNPGAGSLTFYEKGAWALVMLRDKVGDVFFKQAIQNYLKKHAYQNVTIPDFIAEIEQVSGMDLSQFESTWLHEEDFPMEAVQTYLSKVEPSIKHYFELTQKIGNQSENAEAILRPIWATLAVTQLKSNLILDHGAQFSNDFLKEILEVGGVKERQAVALVLEQFPQELKNEMEGLLADASYTTQEAALFKLWSAFPANRTQYLDQTNGLIGFPNKNLRLLWLALALVTPEYHPEKSADYYGELNGYTGPEHHFETRLMAFQYLQSIGGFSDDALKNLIDACDHHVWHFKKSARSILNTYLANENGLVRIRSLYPTLNEAERLFLDEKLGE